ncbi:hypothetical protein EDD17DRAFT_1540661 [Pisolithus thermaeus]|nr:hypothetical protein EDD17DRAFT_1540661 [Pisolithus thermaeus]
MSKFARAHNASAKSPEAIRVKERDPVERPTALSPRPLPSPPNPQSDVRGLGRPHFPIPRKGEHLPCVSSPKVLPAASPQSLESSHQGQDYRRSQVNPVPRFLVRVAEKFKFGIPIQIAGGRRRKLEARLVSGDALPAFMQVELKSYGSSNGRKRAVEFYGVPAEDDIGELHVGIFNMETDECLVRVVVEVIGGN